MTLIPTLAVLYFTAVFFAGEPLWVYSSAELFILTVSLVFLLVFTLRSKPAGNTPLIIYKDPVTLFGLLFLLIMVIIAFGAYEAGDRLWERLKQEPFERIQSTPSLTRPALNKDTWAIIRDYPSLGSGFNTFPYVFTRYAEHSLKYMDHAHNDWMELGAESGGAGLLIILSGLFLAAC